MNPVGGASLRVRQSCKPNWLNAVIHTHYYFTSSGTTAPTAPVSPALIREKAASWLTMVYLSRLTLSQVTSISTGRTGGIKCKRDAILTLECGRKGFILLLLHGSFQQAIGKTAKEQQLFFFTPGMNRYLFYLCLRQHDCHWLKKRFSSWFLYILCCKKHLIVFFSNSA